MNYLVRAEVKQIIEALISAESPDEAAEAFYEGEALHGTIVSEEEPEIIDILEAP